METSSRTEAAWVQARDERRRRAAADAQRLLAEARAQAPDTIVPRTLHLLSRELQVDHVTLTLGLEAQPRGMVYANPRGATPISWSDVADELEPPVRPPVDGAASRLHAFVYGGPDPEQRGRLSLHSMRPRRFGAREIALVDALVELIARELERRPTITSLPAAT